MSVESVPFAPSAKLASMKDFLAGVGIDWPSSPLNISLFLALLAAVGVYLYLWRTRAGYRLRAVGSSPGAATFAGINARHQVVIAMALSGALAAGFTGIAVALMGRNHPVGIVLASVLFGALFQGGAEVAFEVQGFSRDMVVMLQGFIVLFSGAMVYVIAPWLARALSVFSQPLRPKATTAEQASNG
jgi:simple sugar transport system permease protein